MTDNHDGAKEYQPAAWFVAIFFFLPPFIGAIAVKTYDWAAQSSTAWQAHLGAVFCGRGPPPRLPAGS
jgi:membrane associated rhomboid family serine protease